MIPFNFIFNEFQDDQRRENWIRFWIGERFDDFQLIHDVVDQNKNSLKNILQTLAAGDVTKENAFYGHIDRVWQSKWGDVLKLIQYNESQHVYRWNLGGDKHRDCSWAETLFWIFVVKQQEMGFLAKESWEIMTEASDQQSDDDGSCKGLDRILDIPMV